MPGISRVNVDTAGGLIVGGGQFSVFCNGFLVAVKGDTVLPHGPGPHSSAVMVGSSETVFAGGKKICRMGDAASCGDTATGSSNAFAGS